MGMQMKGAVFYDDKFVRLMGDLIGSVMRESEERAAALEARINRIESALQEQRRGDTVRNVRTNRPVRANSATRINK